MISVANYAEGVEKQIPEVLSIGFRWKRWGLPKASWGEIPITLFLCIEAAMNVYTACYGRVNFEEYGFKNVHEWAKLNQSAAKLSIQMDQLRNG